MEPKLNSLKQPIGEAVENWTPPVHPPHEMIGGRYCRLEPLDVVKHAESLFAANSADVEGRSWTYLPYGPFQNFDQYRAWMQTTCTSNDPQFYAIFDRASDRASGVAAYLRIAAPVGSIEVGHLNYSPSLQRTVASTEAMYLLMQQAFELGYRRYEWKCNALNQPSRSAAQRLGLSYEGIFRQAQVVKGRNRDTAWYAAIDEEWPALQDAFERWLDPSNFDEDGRQKIRLGSLTGPILKMRG